MAQFATQPIDRVPGFWAMDLAKLLLAAYFFPARLASFALFDFATSLPSKSESE